MLLLKHICALGAVALLLTACPGGDGGRSETADTQGSSGQQPSQLADTASQPATKQVSPADADPVERGRQIFHGTDYSRTGMSCNMCHATSPGQLADTIFIASTAFGAAPRGAWKISSEQQLAAGQGNAPTLADAANVCITAPYMNNDGKLSDADREAVIAYFESIAVPDAPDAGPFILATSRSLPESGLVPDYENGGRIYEMSCERCHDSGLSIPSLHGASDWLTPIQVMAKVRKIEGDWYNDFEGQSYAAASPVARRMALLGISTAHAAENPCAGNPCAEMQAGGTVPQGEFPKDAMPFYAPRILSDQDVVDVAHYIAERLAGEAGNSHSDHGH